MKKYKPKHGDFFVDLSSKYEDVKIIRAIKGKKGDKTLYAYYYESASKGKKATFIKKTLSSFKGPFFPSIFSRSTNLKGLEEYAKCYYRISRKIEDYLLKTQGSVLIKDIIKHLKEEHDETSENSASVIKILIGEVISYDYKKLNGKNHLAFSNLKLDAEKSKQYYSSLADEIKIKSDKISLLVSHGQTVGNYREHILMELLKKYIPSKFTVATGFIEGISQQIDILIYDSQNHSPAFKEGNLVVVRREAVRAIIEVKSNLKTSKLQEALDAFYNLSRPGVYKPDLPLFKGIFAFDTPYKTSTGIAKCIKDFYTNPYFENQLQEDMTRNLMYLYHEITCVTVLNKHCVFSLYGYANEKETDNVIPSLYSISDERGGDIQTSMFIALLFDYLDIDYYAKKSALKAFSKLHRSKTSNVKLEAKLTSDDWFPNTASHNEHDFKQESIKKRLSEIDKWFNGDITTTDYLKDLEKQND